MNPQVLESVKNLPQTTLFKLILSMALMLSARNVAGKNGIDGTLAGKIQSLSGYTIKDEIKVIRKEVTGQSNRVRLIDTDTKKVQGLSSFVGNQTDSGELFIFRHVAIGYATHATDSGKEKELVYNTDLPAELRNANLVLTVGKDEKLNIPLSELYNYGVAQDSHQDYFQTIGFNFWGEKQEIYIDLEMPAALPISGTIKNYIEVRFKGSAIK